MKYIYSTSIAVAMLATSHAATVSFSSTIATQTTNFAATTSVSQFDSSLGELTAIQVSVTGNTSGTVNFENLDAAEAVVTRTIGATIAVTGPGDFEESIAPSGSTTSLVPAFDGSADFMGDSGVIGETIDGTVTEVFAPADFTPYIGTGDVDFNFDFTAASLISGAGNIISAFQTSAGAEVTVTYTFEPVPEPSSTALLGLGGLALILRRRR